MFYLATPYTDSDPDIVEKRFSVITQITAELMNHGHIIFSPVTHGHPIACAGADKVHYATWLMHGLKILHSCDKLLVAELPGWDKSTGVLAEMQYARNFGICIEHLSLDIITGMKLVDINLIRELSRAENRK